MEILNQKQKVELVLNLLKEGRTYREIQSTAHVGPDFIVKVKKEALGNDYIFENPRTKNSKNTQAIRLIRDGKKNMDVALDLNIDSNEVKKAFWDYLRLKKLDRYAELLTEENQAKLDSVLMIADIFGEKGIVTKEKIYDILKEIRNKECVQQQINSITEVKSNLIGQINHLRVQENCLKKNIRTLNSRNEYDLVNKRRLKKEIFDLEKRLEKLTRLVDDIFNIPAYQHLEETLITNIENVIFEEHQFLPLILMALFEGLKSDPQKIKSLNGYCNRFLGEKLTTNNIEIRIDYLKNEEVWNDTSSFFEQLTKIYSMADFAFVLKEKYKLYKKTKSIVV